MIGSKASERESLEVVHQTCSSIITVDFAPVIRVTQYLHSLPPQYSRREMEGLHFLGLNYSWFGFFHGVLKELAIQYMPAENSGQKTEGSAGSREEGG